MTHSPCSRYRFIAASLAISSLSFTACASTRPVKYYQISVAPAPAVATGKPLAIRLLVGRIDCAPLLRDGRILYRVGAHEVGAYQYHRWVESPDRVVEELLVQVLRSSGKYQAVQDLGSPTAGDYLVRGKLFDFSEIDDSVIKGRVSMEVDLFDRKNSTTVWTHYYSRDEPVDGKNVQDVVHCLERNLLKGLSEIAVGLDQYFAGREAEAADHYAGSTPGATGDGHH